MLRPTASVVVERMLITIINFCCEHSTEPSVFIKCGKFRGEQYYQSSPHPPPHQIPGVSSAGIGLGMCSGVWN